MALPYAPASYSEGLNIRFKVVNANTGPSTVNVNALGTKTVVRQDAGALKAGDLPAGVTVSLTYDGTNFRLDAPSHQMMTDAETAATAASTSETNAATSESNAASSAAAASASEQAIVEGSFARTDVTETFDADVKVTGDLVLLTNNGSEIRGKDSGGTSRDVMGIDGTDTVNFGNPNITSRLKSDVDPVVKVGAGSIYAG